MMRAIGALASVVAMAVPMQAAAQGEYCAARAVIVDALVLKYGEAMIMVGQQGPNTIIELFGNPATGSWTVITTNRAGVSCLMGAGDKLVVAMAGEPA